MEPPDGHGEATNRGTVRCGPAGASAPGHGPLPAAVVAALAVVVPAVSSGQWGAEELVDRVAVVVEGPSTRGREAQLATVWDLFVAANVEVIRRAGPEARSLAVDLDALRGAQRRKVEQLVALREAVRLGRDVAPPSLVDEARDDLAARIGGHDELRAFLRERSVSMESLDAELRREAVVERFTRDSVRLPPSLSVLELEARFAAGGHPYAGEPFVGVLEAFEAWVRARQLEEQRRVWLVELRSRCRLVVFDVTSGTATAPAGREGGG